jgi:hypothetical protein
MVERWLLGRLGHRTFHSLAEVNALTEHMASSHRRYAGWP